jgi:anion-transporting  ArsA/GET3 family ATPase
VLDTPPTKRALDFFEAPERIRDFLDRKVVRWFVMPYLSQGWAAAKAMNRTVGFLFRKLEEATGVSALAEVSDFFSAMSGMFDAFTARTDVIHDILRAPSTAFVLVTGPEEQVLTEAEFFSERMQAMQMPLGGVVFNRVHEEFVADPEAFRGGTVTRVDEDAVRAALYWTRGCRCKHVSWLQSELRRLSTAGARRARFGWSSSEPALAARCPFVTVPNFDTDVLDLASLTRMPRLSVRGRPSTGAPLRAQRRPQRGAVVDGVR